MNLGSVVSTYLSVLDSQRDAAFAALDAMTDDQLRQRPTPKEWSSGGVLNHNYLLFASFFPIVQWMWKLNEWYGRIRRNRPYKTEIGDLYHDPKFPHWVGWCNLIINLRIGIYHDQLHYDDVIKQASEFKK